MKIFDLTSENPKWNEVADFAKRCDWKAGRKLAEKMNNGDFRGWERVFAAYEDNKPVGFCTFTESDCLAPNYLYSPFIGFVYVDTYYRGRRISEQMIDHVRLYARINGQGRIYLMSSEKDLYEKYGFTKLGDYPTTYGTVEQLFYIAS